MGRGDPAARFVARELAEERAFVARELAEERANAAATMVQGLDPDDQEHGIVEVTIMMIDVCIDRGWVDSSIRRDFALHCLNELFRELSRKPLVEQVARDDGYDDDPIGICASYDDSSR